MNVPLAQLYEAGSFLAPAFLMIGAAIASTRFLDGRTDRRVARLGLWALAGQVLIALLVWALVESLPEEPSRSGTCPDMDVLQANAAWILGWASAALGGPAAAAGFVLANRNVWLVRSLCIMVSALALPYVALAVVLWAALCGLS